MSTPIQPPTRGLEQTTTTRTSTGACSVSGAEDEPDGSGVGGQLDRGRRSPSRLEDTMIRQAVLLMLMALTVACGGGTSTNDAGVQPANDAGTMDSPQVSGDAPASDTVGIDTPATTQTDVPRVRPSAANPLPCRMESDCDDGIACTEDFCGGDGGTDGFCFYRARASRCTGGETCDLRTGCRMGRVCTSNSECMDSDPCTVGEECDMPSRICTYARLLDGDNDRFAAPACGGADCNDADPNANPGFAEVCDSRDNNCDGQVDEDPTVSLCSASHNVVCRAGRCVCGTSTPPLTPCSAGGGRYECIDVNASDAQNCGRCGRNCPAPATCVRGVCNCQSGFYYCATDSFAGCIQLGQPCM